MKAVIKVSIQLADFQKLEEQYLKESASVIIASDSR